MSDANNAGDSANTPAPASDEVIFNTEVDMDAELEDIQRQVDNLQEDLQLQQLHDTAAKDEGTRKTAVQATAAASVAPKGNASVFINGLEPRTTEADLRVFFASSGTVARLTILQDRNTGRPKGSAYVEFETPEQAQSATLKDAQSLHGKPLKVALKRDNVPAFQRGGGGGAPGAPRGGGGGFFPGGGRGGRGGAMNPQLAAMATMMATMMAGAAPGFNPYAGGGGGGGGSGRGGGGGGRGRGRGRGRDSY